MAMFPCKTNWEIVLCVKHLWVAVKAPYQEDKHSSSKMLKINTMEGWMQHEQIIKFCARNLESHRIGRQEEAGVQ